MDPPVLAPRVIAALDFGTTFSGFAFCPIADDSKIFQWYDWQDQIEGGGLPYCKTRTQLLLDGDTGDVRAWGWSALVQHLGTAASQAAAGEASNDAPPLEFFDKFKLRLAPGAEGDEASSHDVRELITKYLARLGAVALEHIRKQLGEHIRDCDVQWCITVPAIWDDAAKATMRRAMADAGLVPDAVLGEQSTVKTGSPHPLLMVLEPEAASIYCQRKLSKELADSGGGSGSIMCVDCGGGTVDIIVHRKVEVDDGKLGLREVAKGTGECCGGTYLDSEFVQLLQDTIPVFDEYANNHPHEVLRTLLGKWELQKRSFDGTSGMVIDLPPKLARAIYEHKMNNYETYGAEDDVDDDYGELAIDLPTLTRVFDKVVDRILELIDTQLSGVPGGCSTMLVVGGFAASPYLMRRIKAQFSDRVPLIWQAPQSGSAVVEGAVLYGLRPEVIRTRCARKTYGVSTSRLWEHRFEGTGVTKFIHDETHKDYGRNIFDCFVSEGDEIPVGHTVAHGFLPLYTTQTECDFNIYSSLSRAPISCNESGVTKEGSVNLDVTPYVGKLRPLVATFSFGKTELLVTARDVTTCEQKSVSIAFTKTYK